MLLQFMKTTQIDDLIFLQPISIQQTTKLRLIGPKMALSAHVYVYVSLYCPIVLSFVSVIVLVNVQV